jgi:hypothetical protein
MERISDMKKAACSLRKAALYPGWRHAFGKEESPPLKKIMGR